MNKIDLILELVKDGKITTEQAKILMVTEKEYVYYPSYPASPWTPPYTITYGSTNGYVQAVPATTSGDTTITFTSN